MITVTIIQKNNSIVKLEVKGHSNSAPYGEDLVCAGVSAIITGGLNAILKVDNTTEYLMNEGHVIINNLNHDSKIQIIINTVITQLKTVEESYQKYIKIIEKNQ